MRRRFEYKDRELEDFLIRFYPAGNYTWIVPEGCFSVDVFLVGGGGSGSSAGGGSGETNTGVVFQGGISDYSEGSGTGGSTNGSGKGGGGVRYSMVYAGAGGDGTVLIRGRRYKS